jgi:rhodanese-related sulfurtransferase
MHTIKAQIESKAAVLLDVREPHEWNAGHVKQAVSLPISVAKDQAKCADALAKLDKSKPIYCHCKMGGRARAFAEMVQDMGFDVRPMKQPFTEIAACGLEIVIETGR